MKRLFVAVTISVLAGPLAPHMVRAVDPQWQQADDYVSRGEKEAARGEWQPARNDFAAAAQWNPRNVVALYDLGVAEAHLGNFDAGVAAERQAVSVDERYVPAYIEMGVILSRMGDYKGATAAEEHALKIDPGNKTAQKNLEAIQRLNARFRPMLPPPVPSRSPGGRGLLTSGDRNADSASLVASARGNYAEIQDVQNFLSAGARAYHSGELQLARQHFEQAVLTASDSSQAHAGLGVVLGSEGNIDAEMVEEKRAAGIDPTNAAAYVNIGWVEAKKQHWGEALRNYDHALAINPFLVQAQVGKGLALLNSGKRSQALDCLNQAVAQSPDNAPALTALGSALLQDGQADKAVPCLEKAAALKPSDTIAKQQLALAYLASGATDKAVVLLRRLAASDDAAETHAGLGLALQMQGDSAGAELEAKRALRLNPRLQLAQSVLDKVAQERVEYGVH